MIADQTIDSYLTALRTHLGPMTLHDRDEIIREIGAHIRDSVEGSDAAIEAVLARLGPADELAGQYRDGLLIRRASRSFSPLVLLRGTLRLATGGVFGIILFLVGMFGYTIGGGLVVSGLFKPIFPRHTGLWMRDGHLLGLGTQLHPTPPPSSEVLGYWYILVMIVAGSLTLLLTMFLIRTALRLSKMARMKLK
jgi:hypothetical protein